MYCTSYKVHIGGGGLTLNKLVKIRQVVDQGLATCLLLKVNKINYTSNIINYSNTSKQIGWDVVTSRQLGDT